MRKMVLAFGCATAMLAGGSPARAGSVTGDIIVSATILDNCLVTVGALAFGDLLSPGSADKDGTGTITLACTPNAGYDVSLNNGLNADGSTRRMKNLLSDDYLPYEIYLDPARSTPWNSVNTVAGNASLLGVAVLTAYGRIEASDQSVVSGAYTDTVRITVDF